MAAMSALRTKRLYVQRRITANLIERDPWRIALKRVQPGQDDGAGGRLPGKEVTLPAADRILLGLSGAKRLTNPTTRMHSDQEGDRFVGRYILLGLYDDDIKKNDKFVIGDDTFVVREVHPDRSYQVKAFVEVVTDGS